jgi:hypothetical protein
MLSAPDIKTYSLLLRATAVLFVAAVPGCAQHAPLKAIDSGTEIRISISDQDIRDPETWDTGESIGSGVVGGMGVGAYAGVSASEACGPFFIFCAPVFALGGATAGAVGGFVYGAATGLPEEKAEALEELMGSLVLGDAPLAAEFRNAVGVELESNWSVVTTGNVPEVMIGPLMLSAIQKTDDELEFQVHTSVVVKYGPRPKRDITETWRVMVSLPRLHVDEWLADDGILLVQESEQAVQTLAKSISGRLSRSYGG